MVVIESPVPTCPFPELRHGTWVIPISDKGRGCSRKDIGAYYNDSRDYGPVRIAFSNAIGTLLPDAPDPYLHHFDELYEWATDHASPSPPVMDLVSVLVWAPIVDRDCEDLKRRMMIFWVGNATDYKKSLEEDAIPDKSCAPTPWP